MMNTKMQDSIIDFNRNVGWYINMEYDELYHKSWQNDKYINNDLFNFIAGYYMGGATVPEVAQYLVSHMKRFER